jgi:hypothetical protein
MANMMNMASQQRAAQLQGERIRQDMEYAQAGETRAAETQRLNVRKEDQAFRIAGMTELRNRGVGVLKSGSEAAYQLWLKQADAIDPDSAAVMREIAPTFNKDALTFAIMKADEYLDKAIPNAEASVEIAAEGGVDAQGRRVPAGTPVQITTGIDANTRAIPMAGAATPPRATPTAPQPSAMERGPSAAADAPMTFGPDETRPLNATQQEDLRRIQSETGMTDTPASFTRGGMGGAGAVQMTPEVAQQIVDAAVKTGMMAQADFDQLMALAPAQNKQPFMDMIQANNIKLQPGGMGQQSQFADLRGQRMQSQTAGLRGAPPMEQTLAQYQPVMKRDPNVPLAPGTSVVPLGRLGAEKTTEAQATADVNLRMAPEIAKATKLAERAVEQKSNATRAKYATEGILSEVADRINTIDELLRNPNRFSIVGAIEGNLPRLLQTGARADAQAAFDKIKNTATLTSLIDMRKSTETGASPVGANPTDKDAKIVEQAASKLIQTGEPATFDAELIDMRRKLYRTYQSAQREYDGVYGDVLKDNPRLRLVVPKVSDRYISTKDLPKQKTPVKTPTSRLSAETRAKYGL